MLHDLILGAICFALGGAATAYFLHRGKAGVVTDVKQAAADVQADVKKL